MSWAHTNSVVATAMAEAAVAEVGEELDVWLLPTLEYTKSNEHAWSPGTVWLSATTLLAVLDDLFPGHPVGAQRHNGFLKGMGMTAPDAKSNELGGKAAGVACMADSYGDAAKGQTGMENCLQKNPGINLVYTINEPAAAGAYKALKAAGKEKDVVIVSVDGGCQGVRDVGAGVIAATSQQYPLKMASMGVAAGVQYAKDGKRQSGYTDTGVTLIAQKALPGIKSADVKTGTDLCWGNK